MVLTTAGVLKNMRIVRRILTDISDEIKGPLIKKKFAKH